MEYILIINDKINTVIIDENDICLFVTNTYLLSNDSFFKTMLNNEKRLDKYNLSDKEYNLLEDYIIGKIDYTYLKNNFDFMKFITMFSTINKLKEEYSFIKNIDNISLVKCNKDNLISALDFSSNLNDVTIDIRSMSLKDYNSILSNYNFDRIKNRNIKIYYQEDNTPIDPLELYEVSCLITEEINKINGYNLSVVEKVMYIYDIVKGFKYNKESGNDPRASRDLDQILKTDNMVCMGYVSLFRAFIKCLNIKSVPLNYLEDNHQNCMAYIKDSKYDIDGIYCFDMTWDRKRNPDKTYMSNYSYFALLPSTSNNIFKNKYYSLINLSLEDITKLLEKDDKNKEEKEMVNRLNELYYLTGNNNFYQFVALLKKDKNKFIEIYNSIILKVINEDIDSYTFLEILYNVRKIQYYNGFVDDITYEELENSLIRRNNFIFKKNSLSLNEEEIEEQKYVLNIDQSAALIDTKESIPSEKEKLNIKLLKVLKKRKNYDNR